MQLTITIFVRGLGGAINTLASQAFGAHNTRLAEVWLTAGLLMSPFMILIIAGLWTVTGNVVGVFASNQTMGDASITASSLCRSRSYRH